MTNPLPETRAGDTRPLLAVAAGHYTPYKVHFHTRLVNELTEMRLVSLMTKRRTNQWINVDRPEINTLQLDAGSLDDAKGLKKLIRELRTARALVTWLKQHRPAALLVAGYDELPMIAAIRWARRRGVPVYIGADSNVMGDHARGLKKLIKRFYIPWIAKPPVELMLCGEVGKAFFRRYGLRDEHMHVMPYEPDYSIIENCTNEQADTTLAKLRLKPGRRRLLNCNRLVDVKRVDLVIDAFSQIAESRPEWDLLIAGDGPLRESLQARVPRHLQDAERVRFLGFQDQAAVTALYRVSDVFVLTSDYEPWAVVVNEAACAGLPIIASSAVGAATEIVRDGVSGVITPTGDLDAVVRALREITEPGRSEAMGRASRAELERWRTEADPVQGLRKALMRSGVIPARQ